MKGRGSRQNQLMTYFSYHHHERRYTKAEQDKTIQPKKVKKAA